MAKKNWKKLLKDCPTIPWDKALYRFVAKGSLDRGKPPNYLFTSGGRGRCNPDGVHCIYLGEDAETALVEFGKYYPDVPPAVLYRVELQAAAVIDLVNPKTCKHLGITDKDFLGSFRLKTKATLLELLGQQISKQTGIAAIRFPSAACLDKGKKGNNLVIFKDALATPDFLKVYVPDSASPDRWP